MHLKVKYIKSGQGLDPGWHELPLMGHHGANGYAISVHKIDGETHEMPVKSEGYPRVSHGNTYVTPKEKLKSSMVNTTDN